MRVLEYRAYGTAAQYEAVDEAIRTATFVRNKCIRLWRDAGERGEKVTKYDLSKYTTQLRAEYSWCKTLNSSAVQAAGERAWASISRFYERVKAGVKPVGYPAFQRLGRSVEYKVSGWSLDVSRRRPRITFTDANGIGTLKLRGGWSPDEHPEEDIRRVRLVRRADGCYVQLCVSSERREYAEPSGKAIGLDMGLTHFYTDSKGGQVENPRYLRKSEKQLKRAQRRVSKKFRKGKKQSSNYKKAKQRLAKKHLEVSRQRRDHAVKAARCVVESNDLIAYEDLKVRNMVKNHCLAKSISDVGWRIFREWLEYYGAVFGKVTVAVPPEYTSQDCHRCGRRVVKGLSERTHACICGAVLDRDHNAALNILERGLATVGHTGSREGASPSPTLVERDVRPHDGSSRSGQPS